MSQFKRRHRYRCVKWGGSVETLEQRWLMVGDLTTDPVGDGNHSAESQWWNSGVEVDIAEFIASIPESQVDRIPQVLLDAEVGRIVPAVSAGSATGDPPDTPEDRVDPNDGGRFGGVVSVEVQRNGNIAFICSGVVVAPRFVLTAGHCFDAQEPLDGLLDDDLSGVVHLNNGSDFSSSHDVANISVHPDFAPGNSGGNPDDLAVLELATAVPPDTPIYRIRESPLQLGERFEFAGYGRSGNGDTGFTTPATLTIKRVGQNVITLLPGNDIFLMDFDNNDPEDFGVNPPAGSVDFTLGNDIESTFGPGDSGGPAFSTGTEEPELVGLMTFQFPLGNITPPAGFFNSLAGGIDIFPYVDFIKDFIGVDLQVTTEETKFQAPNGAEQLVYTISVTNAGPNTATNAVFDHELVAPAAVTVDSAVPTSGSFSESTWTIPSIAPGDTEQLVISLNIGQAVDGFDVISSTTTLVDVVEPDTDSSNDSSTVTSTIDFVDIAITQTETVDPIGYGASNLTYTVFAENLGNQPATNVVISELLELPSGVTFDFPLPKQGVIENNNWIIGQLNPGEVAELDIILSVTSSAEEAVDAIKNTASLTSVDQGDLDPSNNVSTETTTIEDLGVDLAITQAVSSSIVSKNLPGETLVYVVTVENLGTTSAPSALIDNVVTIPTSGVQIESISVSDGILLNDTAWILSGVDGGEKQTLTVTLSVDSTAPIGADLISNTAELTFVAGIDSDLTNNSSTESVSIMTGADVEITISESADPAVAGSAPGNLVYTVTATNVGVADAVDVHVDTSLALPDGVSFVSSSSSVGTLSGSTWNVGTLAPGASHTLDLVLTVGESAVEATDSILATASLSAMDEPDDNPANNVATIATSVAEPDVDLVLSFVESVDPVEAGSGLVYTLLVQNNGPQAATNVEINTLLNLPAGVTILLDEGTSTGQYDLPTWTIPVIQPGSTEALSLEIGVSNLAASGTDVIGVTATLESVDQIEGDPSNNIASVATSINGSEGSAEPEVDIVLTQIESTDPVTAGSGAGNLTYTIVATNAGTTTATGVLINQSLDLPEGVIVESIAASSGIFSAPNWNLLSIAPDSSETLTITLTVPESITSIQSITSSAQVVALLEEDSDLTNNQVSSTTTIEPAGPSNELLPDVAITIEESSDPVVAGSGVGSLVYTITATNVGAVPATGATIRPTLDLPTGVSVESIVPVLGFFSDPDWNIVQLQPNESASLIVTLNVATNAEVGTDAITVSATRTGLLEQDGSSLNDTATESTSIVPESSASTEVDIALAFAESSDLIPAGDTNNLVYTLTATNNGPATATGILINASTLLADGVILDDVVPSVGVYTQPVWSIVSLASGAQATLTFTMTVDESTAPATDAISASANLISLIESDTNATNNAAEESSSVALPNVDIQLTQSESVDPVVAGSGVGNLVYTITATNLGPSTATNLSIDSNLTLVEGVSLDSVTPDVGSFDSNVWNVGTLGSGESATLTLTLTVGADAEDGVDVVVSNAVVASVAENDVDDTNDTATTATTIEAPVAGPPSNVFVDGSRWAVTNGFELAVGPNSTLPWTGIDQVQFVYDTAQIIAPTVSLLGPDASSEPIDVTLESWDGSNGLATFPALEKGYYQLEIAGEVYDFSVLYADGDPSGAVGFADFALLARNFGIRSTELHPADFNADGRVGFADFAILARNFGDSLEDLVPPPPPATPAVHIAIVDNIFAVAGQQDDDDDLVD